MNKHTPTPWAVAYGSVWHVQNDDRQSLGPRIADMARDDDGTIPTERDANAEFICRAVNSHDALLSACLRAVIALEDCWSHKEGVPGNLAPSIDAMRVAISQATGNAIPTPAVSENLNQAL